MWILGVIPEGSYWKTSVPVETWEGSGDSRTGYGKVRECKTRKEVETKLTFLKAFTILDDVTALRWPVMGLLLLCTPLVLTS